MRRSVLNSTVDTEVRVGRIFFDLAARSATFRSAASGDDAADGAQLMMTLALGGLWHGAAWTFELWEVSGRDARRRPRNRLGRPAVADRDPPA